jgi:hypothetical protein
MVVSCKLLHYGLLFTIVVHLASHGKRHAYPKGNLTAGIHKGKF